jgi:hypothetical protein
MSARFVLVVVLAVGLAVAWEVFCLHDLVRADRVRYLPKWGWAIVCLFSIPLGGIIYLIVGRTGD